MILFVTGHVFAYGLSRSAAITNMALALKEIQIRGEIHSNVDYTVDLLNVRNINHLFKASSSFCWSYTIVFGFPWHLNPWCYLPINQASDFRENKIHTGWLDTRIAMRVQAERPPWYISVVGGALYVRNNTTHASTSLELLWKLWSNLNHCYILQKTVTANAATVSDYVSYLTKGQIPPKVCFCGTLVFFCADEEWLTNNSFMQHISLVNSTVNLNIEGSKYTVSVTFV